MYTRSVFYKKHIDKTKGICYTFLAILMKGSKNTMTLCEELYFDITLMGAKSEIKKLVSFLRSGELDDFFEFSDDYLSFCDEFDDAGADERVSMTLSNDDWGIEIDEFDTDEFLEVFCRAAKNLFVNGELFDIDDEQYSFISEEGDSYYVNSLKAQRFNEDDDKDTLAEKEA